TGRRRVRPRAVRGVGRANSATTGAMGGNLSQRARTRRAKGRGQRAKVRGKVRMAKGVRSAVRPLIRTKSVWSPIDRRRDGLRILATRFRGRGMPVSRYDVWMPSLGPSERLLKSVLADGISWTEFTRRYREELFLDGPIDSRS